MITICMNEYINEILKEKKGYEQVLKAIQFRSQRLHNSPRTRTMPSRRLFL